MLAEDKASWISVISRGTTYISLLVTKRDGLGLRDAPRRPS